ncbi:C-X-C motif chemokine 10-like isoform X2 [Bombina bombina]|uniref:C-X-C motif chemokine 10-like isoform X2 n=1 Tax=Bombina bombina TaxID=8345 RepID=UPI00235AF042|nr:C-X-C motif chemokine 10-like isoform X2 [Bombina bombina]
MDSRSALIICILLSATVIQVFSVQRSDRCLCKELANKIKNASIEKLVRMPKSHTCGKVEIIATIKGSQKIKCLDPKARAIKKLLKMRKQMEKKA